MLVVWVIASVQKFCAPSRVIHRSGYQTLKSACLLTLLLEQIFSLQQ